MAATRSISASRTRFVARHRSHCFWRCCRRASGTTPAPTASSISCSPTSPASIAPEVQDRERLGAARLARALLDRLGRLGLEALDQRGITQPVVERAGIEQVLGLARVLIDQAAGRGQGDSLPEIRGTCLRWVLWDLAGFHDLVPDLFPLGQKAVLILRHLPRLCDQLAQLAFHALDMGRRLRIVLDLEGLNLDAEAIGPERLGRTAAGILVRRGLEYLVRAPIETLEQAVGETGCVLAPKPRAVRPDLAREFGRDIGTG